MSLLKFWGRFIALIISPLVAESYSTILRAMGLGVGGAISRIASAMAPFIVYELFLIENYLPYLIFSIGFFVCLIIMCTFPLD